MSRVSRFRPDGLVVMRPQWHNLLFLHWEFEPALVQKLLPEGLELDLFEGRAYVGLVPFQMAEVRPRFVPDLGKFGHFYSRFPELNVRTYVMRDGVPGVWFFSLDAASSLAVMTARIWFRLPYFKARMRVHENKDSFDYWSKRLWPAPFEATCRVRFQPEGHAQVAAPDSLEEFLVERYVLYSRQGNQLYRGRVFHEPYQLQGAQIKSLRESCLRATGFERPSHTPHILFSRGVNVEVWGLGKMLKRATLPFDFVILVCCAFVFLTLAAMAFYPGGTTLHPKATSYLFFENFFSDLGRTITKGSHKPNPASSLLFFIALSSAGIALGIFTLAFARFFWGTLAQRVATTAGVLFGLLSAYNFLGIAWYQADLHNQEHIQCVYGAFKCFPGGGVLFYRSDAPRQPQLPQTRRLDFHRVSRGSRCLSGSHHERAFAHFVARSVRPSRRTKDGGLRVASVRWSPITASKASLNYDHKILSNTEDERLGTLWSHLPRYYSLTLRSTLPKLALLSR